MSAMEGLNILGLGMDVESMTTWCKDPCIEISFIKQTLDTEYPKNGNGYLVDLAKQLGGSIIKVTGLPPNRDCLTFVRVCNMEDEGEFPDKRVYSSKEEIENYGRGVYLSVVSDKGISKVELVYSQLKLRANKRTRLKRKTKTLSGLDDRFYNLKTALAAHDGMVAEHLFVLRSFCFVLVEETELWVPYAQTQSSLFMVNSGKQSSVQPSSPPTSSVQTGVDFAVSCLNNAVSCPNDAVSCPKEFGTSSDEESGNWSSSCPTPNTPITAKRKEVEVEEVEYPDIGVLITSLPKRIKVDDVKAKCSSDNLEETEVNEVVGSWCKEQKTADPMFTEQSTKQDKQACILEKILKQMKEDKEDMKEEIRKVKKEMKKDMKKEIGEVKEEMNTVKNSVRSIGDALIDAKLDAEISVRDTSKKSRKKLSCCEKFKSSGGQVAVKSSVIVLPGVIDGLVMFLGSFRWQYQFVYLPFDGFILALNWVHLFCDEKETKERIKVYAKWTAFMTLIVTLMYLLLFIPQVANEYNIGIPFLNAQLDMPFVQPFQCIPVESFKIHSNYSCFEGKGQLNPINNIAEGNSCGKQYVMTSVSNASPDKQMMFYEKGCTTPYFFLSVVFVFRYLIAQHYQDPKNIFEEEFKLPENPYLRLFSYFGMFWAIIFLGLLMSSRIYFATFIRVFNSQAKDNHGKILTASEAVTFNNSFWYF